MVPALLAVAGCREPRRPTKIGVVFFNRNSPAAFMAADEINSAGGIRGRLVQIVRDTIPTSAEPADVEIQRARSIVAQGPLAVVGHGGSRGSLMAAPVYNDAHVIQIVPTGTTRLLARAGEWTLPLPPNDSLEGAFIAAFVRDRLGAGTVVIFYQSDEYGVGLRDGVVAGLAGSAVRVLREQRYDLRSPMDALVDASVRAEAPDVVVVAGRTPATVAIVRRLATLGLASRVVAGDGAVNLPDLVEQTGPAGQDRVFAATFWLRTAQDSASRRFVNAFEGRVLHEATATDALVYDAVRLIGEAVREVGDDPDNVLRYLRSLGRSRPAHRGVTGALGFGDIGLAPRLVMGVVRGGTLVAADSAWAEGPPPGLRP